MSSNGNKELSARADIERLARRHGAALYKYALALTGHASDAWDLLQDTYERAMRAEMFRSDAHRGPAWLHVVMKNRFLDLWRARHRRPVQDQDVDLLATPEPDDPPSWLRYSADEVHACLTSLDAPLRDVYQLHAIDGLSYAEISSRLRLPGGTVATRIFRARRKLRAALSCHDDERAAA